MRERSKHFVSIDLLRLLAAFGVVALHCCTTPWQEFLSEPLTLNWWMVHALSSTKICVPLFVMISGFFLLDTECSAWEWSSYRKRLAKVFTPLVAWVCLYSLLSLVDLHVRGQLSFVTVRDSVIYGSSYFHLWYLFMIIGVYAFSPFFSAIVQQITPPQRPILLFFLFCFAQIYWLMTAFIGRKYYCVMNDMLVFPPYLFYFFAGIFIRRCWIPRMPMWVLILVFIFSWGTGVVGESILFVLRGKPIGLFYSHFSPTVIGMTLSLFSLILIQESALKSAREWIRQSLFVLGKTTLGCYCVHYIVLQNVYLLHIDAWIQDPIILALANTVCVFAISVAIVLVLCKIPLVRKVV